MFLNYFKLLTLTRSSDIYILTKFQLKAEVQSLSIYVLIFSQTRLMFGNKFPLRVKSETKFVALI